MSYICGTSINLTIKCNTQNETFEFYESNPEEACFFTLEDDLDADLDVPWYATSSGGSITVNFEPEGPLDVLSIEHSASDTSVTITKTSSYSFVISYTGSSEPSCDFEVSNPNNTYTEPKPKLILLPIPSGPPTI
jgi:hypothetical protein